MTDSLATPHLIEFDDEFLELQRLEEMARRSAEDGDFKDASKHQKNFRVRLQQECARQVRLLQQRQAGEIAELQARARQDMEECEDEHHESVSRLRSQEREYREELQVKHRYESEDARRAPSARHRASSALLNLERRQERLRKLRDYDYAHKVQQQAEELRAKEERAAVEAGRARVRARLGQLARRHAAEVSAFRERCAFARRKLDQRHKEAVRQVRDKYGRWAQELDHLHSVERNQQGVFLQRCIAKGELPRVAEELLAPPAARDANNASGNISSNSDISNSSTGNYNNNNNNSNNNNSNSNNNISSSSSINGSGDFGVADGSGQQQQRKGRQSGGGGGFASPGGGRSGRRAVGRQARARQAEAAVSSPQPSSSGSRAGSQPRSSPGAGVGGGVSPGSAAGLSTPRDAAGGTGGSRSPSPGGSPSAYEIHQFNAQQHARPAAAADGFVRPAVPPLPIGSARRTKSATGSPTYSHRQFGLAGSPRTGAASSSGMPIPGIPVLVSPRYAGSTIISSVSPSSSPRRASSSFANASGYHDPQSLFAWAHHNQQQQQQRQASQQQQIPQQQIPQQQQQQQQMQQQQQQQQIPLQVPQSTGTEAPRPRSSVSPRRGRSSSPSAYVTIAEKKRDNISRLNGTQAVRIISEEEQRQMQHQGAGPSYVSQSPQPQQPQQQPQQQQQVVPPPAAPQSEGPAPVRRMYSAGYAPAGPAPFGATAVGGSFHGASFSSPYRPVNSGSFYAQPVQQQQQPAYYAHQQPVYQPQAQMQPAMRRVTSAVPGYSAPMYSSSFYY